MIAWGLSSLVGGIWKWSNPPRTTLYMNCSDNKKPTAPRPAITPTKGLQIATRPTRGVDHKAASRLNNVAKPCQALLGISREMGFSTAASLGYPRRCIDGFRDVELLHPVDDQAWMQSSLHSQSSWLPYTESCLSSSHSASDAVERDTTRSMHRRTRACSSKA